MALVVLSYPVLSEPDYSWIQTVREKHDPLHHALVAPHFTFVFPDREEEVQSLADHVRAQSRGFGPIPFILRCASVVKDAFNETTHVFLVPEEGYGAMIRLHDALYRGRLAAKLRLDIPYIPHIGIGTSTDPQACKRLADQLNGQSLAVRGTIQKLDIASYDGRLVNSLEQIGL